jgi:hypothetical protein
MSSPFSKAVGCCGCGNLVVGVLNSKLLMAAWLFVCCSGWSRPLKFTWSEDTNGGFVSKSVISTDHEERVARVAKMGAQTASGRPPVSFDLNCYLRCFRSSLHTGL